MPSSHLILCRPLLLLPPIPPSITVFSSESVLHIKWPNYWSFSFSISHSNAYSGLISFRIDWFGLVSVQGTLRSLLQNHGSKVSILQCSAFFMVQFAHPHVATRKPQFESIISWCSSAFFRASLIAQSVKNLPAMQETWVRFLGWEDSLEEEMASHASILAWKISWTEEPRGLQSMGLQRVGYDRVTSVCVILSS